MKFNKQIAWLLMVMIAITPIAQAGPFVSGQVLTASQLNNVVDSKTDNAAAAITGGTITGASINNSVIGATTPAAIYKTNTIAISAAGTTQGTATALTAQFNKVTTAAAGSGVVLFTPVRAGLMVAIDNDTANSLNVYPQVSGSIDALGANNPMVVPPNGSIILVSADTLVWDSYLSNDQVFNNIRAYGTITPNSASGIVGTATSDSAQAGSIGEYLSSTLIAASAVSLTSASAVGLTSVSLSAGDWDVSGVVCYHGSGTTNVTDVKQGINTASAVMPAIGGYSYNYVSAVVATADDACQVTPTSRFSLAASATAYLNAMADFTVSTLTSYGFIRARRAR